MIKIKHLTESLNRKYALEGKNVNRRQKSLQESTSNTIKDYSWSKFLDKVEAATGFKVDSAYRRGYDQWIELIDDQGKIRDAEITKYFDGEYELNLSNISTYIHEEYSLVGQDGNAFSLMGYTARCMKECGLRDEIDEMRKLAMSGDYYNLIRVCDDYIQKCNEINPDLDESYNINEEKWGYTLKNGGRLRKAISNEDYRDIIKSIYYCYEELKEKGIIDEDDFERYTDEFDLYLDHDLEDYDEPEEVINYELNDLYDLCDNLNVWVSLDESFDDTWYFGKEEAEQFGDLILKNLTGKKVSKRIEGAENPGGLIYEADKLGIDKFELLGALEGLCHQGKAREIDDSTYLVVGEKSLDESLNEDLQDTIDKIIDNYKVYKNRNNAGLLSIKEEGLKAFEEFSIKYPNLKKTLQSKIKDDFKKDLVKSNIGLAIQSIGLLDESLNEDVQKEVFDKPGEFWYFTKHGVGPGSVPKGITIEKTIDKDGGEYFLIKNKILSTDALNRYEIKEKSPYDIEEDWEKPKDVDNMTFEEMLDLYWKMNGQWAPYDMGMEPDEIDAYFRENPDALKLEVEEGLKWYE